MNSSPIREGVTIAGNTTLGVGTSALLTPGLGDREIRTTYDANNVYQAGTAQAPEGWTLEYSTNNGSSWSTTEPTPASGVTDIRARKTSVAAGAIDGYSQEYSTETTAAIPSNTFAASSGGDGWGVAFYDNYIFNIYHHQNTTILSCKLKSTGGNCPSPNTTITNQISGQNINYYASNRSDVAVNALDGELYAITAPTSGTDAGKAGVLCIDVKVSPPVGCGFTPLTDSTTTTSYAGITDISKAGDRYFGVAVYSPRQLLCYDASTNQKCANSPITLEGTVDVGRTLVHGDRVYTKTNSKLYCHVVATLSTCTGSWPKSFSGTNDAYQDFDLILHADASGNPDGVCTKELGCMDFDGVSKTWVNPYSVIPLGSYSVYSRGVTTLGRWYLTHYHPTNFPSVSVVSCFDFSTDAACAGFTSLQNQLWYQVTVDPENPACLWLNSNPGDIKNFDAYTGAAGCSSNPVVTLQPSQFAPRYACSTTNGIDQWLTIRLASLAGGGSATSIKLTIRNPQGVAVTNWTNRVIALNTPIDMSAIDVLQTGSRPTFSFAFSGITGTISSAVVQLDYKGKGPELCSSVKTTTPANDTAATIKGFLIDSVGNGSTFESRRNFTVGGTGVATQSNLNQTVPSAPRNLTGTGLNTTATLTFEPPADNGGLDLGNYQLSLDAGSSWSSVTNLVDNGNGTFSIPISNLTPGTQYSIRLAATNVLGRGAAASLTLSAQTVSLNNLQDTELSAGPIYMATQSNNALPYTYTVTPSSVCTVSGTVISLVSVGSCSVTQDQAGDANNIATTASATFNVLADPVVATVPGVPQNLAASPASQQVSLSWSAPASNGGAAISDYIVQYKVGTSWIPFTDGVSTSTSTVITGLTNGTAYDFKVAAVNSVGQGLFTTAVTSTPATTPGAPTSLSPNKSGTSASLTWSAPASNGGSAITDYIVDYKLTTDATWTTFTDTVTATTGATVTGLTSNAAYDFRVRTKNIVGLSAAVSTVNLVATNGNAQVSLTWSAPNTGGAAIVNYIIQYRAQGTATWTDQDTGSTNTSGSTTGLTNGTKYDFRVAAVVLDGSSNPIVSSYTSTVEVAPFTAPAAPVASVSKGNQQLLVSWTAPATNGADLTDYRIQYRAVGAANWITASDGVSTNTSYTITSLTNGTDYEVQVAAQNSAGFGSYSTVVIAAPRTVPGPISNLAITPGAGSFTLSWTAPTSNGGAAITDYEIQYKLLSSTSWSSFSHTASTATSHQVPDLLGLTRYSVRVAAVNEAGIGSFGAAGSEITLQVVYQITWDATTNGGQAISPASQNFSPGDTPLVAPTPATRSGMTFLGWYNHQTAGAKILDAGAALTPSSTMTLYGRWAAANNSNNQNSGSATSQGYIGPNVLHYSNREPVAKEKIILEGTNLKMIDTIKIDGVVCEIKVLNDSKIELIVPESVTPGAKDLLITYSGSATLHALEALKIMIPENKSTKKVNARITPKLVAIYQRGYPGANLSWSVNGKWGRATSTRSYNYWHVPINSDAKPVKVKIYVNGKLTTEKLLKK